jgi:hypothetical protein
MATCMIIPTYWSTPKLPSWNVFDHPIPVAEAGTLGRTLDNLETCAYPDPVILFPAPTDPEVEEKVRGIAAGRSLDIRVVTNADLSILRSALRDRGFPENLLAAVTMDSYGGVRNCGLIYAAFHGFDDIVMIDDDECIDSGYRAAALRSIGSEVGGATVLGKTGCVVDEQGRKLYDGQASHYLAKWPKDALFNEAVRQELSASSSLSPCTVAFGGNMVLDKGMYLQVPFDPYGARGEDDDYVLNARYCGLPFFFDRDLVLLHLPPARTNGHWMRQRQDILRFKYVREKARLFGFAPETLGVFLAHFTREDLEYKAVSSSIDAALHFVDRDHEEFREFLNNAVLASAPTLPELRSRAEMFLRFLDAWRSAMPRIFGEA